MFSTPSENVLGPLVLVVVREVIESIGTLLIWYPFTEFM